MKSVETLLQNAINAIWLGKFPWEWRKQELEIGNLESEDEQFTINVMDIWKIARTIVDEEIDKRLLEMED